MGQRMNRLVGTLVARPTLSNTPRIARRVHQLLARLGYPQQNYKISLLTEAQCLRAQAAHGPPGPAWAGMYMPATRLAAYQFKQYLLGPLRVTRQGWQHLRAGLRRQGTKTQQAGGAGLFLGMNYRFCSANDARALEPERYAEVSREATRLLHTFQVISPGRHGQGTIGILVSCYRPEPFIEDFLNNLGQLATPERLIPVVINAGMEAQCEARIEAALRDGAFHSYHLLNRPGASIYEAWNSGITALGNSAEFITNFNVDDRRHPLCLNVQAEALNAFGGKQVAITDYCYFFESLPQLETIYANNATATTLIPTVNQRTLVDHNFPHSGPLWRSQLHNPKNCGLFNTSYQSAGDAEFWYRVSRRHPDAFQVISIPLNLYFQNPNGLSTKPETAGAQEHKRCTKEHYAQLINAMENAINSEFAEAHLELAEATHLQLHAYLSALKATAQQQQRPVTPA